MSPNNSKNEQGIKYFMNRTQKNNTDLDRLITVCSECLTVTCWQGMFMCTKSRTAGTIQKTAAELLKLGLEHPAYWGNADAEMPIIELEVPECYLVKKSDYIEMLEEALNAIVMLNRISCQKGNMDRCQCRSCIVKRIEEALTEAKKDD